MIPYPEIDPVLFSIGPLAIRWYSLAYVVGIVGGSWYADKLNQKINPKIPNLKISDDFMIWAILGIIIGGRFGYVFFYNAAYFLDYPAEIFKVWQGGMSFHGGLLGVIISSIIFCKLKKIPVFGLFDILACTAPIGLFFGRIANFINGELYGRPTESPIGMVFPAGGPVARHPSQLYEAFLEGLVLFLVLAFLSWKTKARSKPGFLSGVFMIGYGSSRIIVENFREPDAHIGFLFGQITTGQLLSYPMIITGFILLWWSSRERNNG